MAVVTDKAIEVVERFLKLILKVDSRIEVHPFRPEDFTEDDLFVREILKNGMELKV
ncbi:MAG: hypothetical protein GXP46_12730 [Deferribacteres bacterium]|nr:hypothetical protein [Deferribacteres bacterium]